MDWAKIWDDICTYFKTNAWNIVWFFAILVIGLIVIKILLVAIRKILKHTKMEKIAQQFICTILKFVLWLALVLILLSQLGLEITGILTAFSAILLAVGMALQNAIANVANGIIIISSHMFKKGDYIITNGVEGKITDINFMFTTLITNDNKKITLPNSTLINNNVTNLGAFPRRRVDFTFSVAYETDVELVKKIVTDVMKSDGRVYLDPAPFCRLKILNASSIDFAANCWCDNEDYWDVYYYIIENVYNEFKRKNISIPYNQLEVRERKDKVVMPVTKSKLPERVEKVRPKEHENAMESLTKLFVLKKGEPKQKKQKLSRKERKALKKNPQPANAPKLEETIIEKVEPKAKAPAKTKTTTSAKAQTRKTSKSKKQEQKKRLQPRNRFLINPRHN